jgi:DNA ligase-associated metallophosphoesterase
MNDYLEIDLFGEQFFLLPQKALFRPLKLELILADAHLGKTTHFRSRGIPLPQEGLLRDIDMLHFLMNKWQPKQVLFLGDLFHSHYNKEWIWFKSFLDHYPATRFILVEGNHDILKDHHYERPNLSKTMLIEEEDLIFTHEPLQDPSKFNVCGHIHPGLRIEGLAKESVKLPCFCLSKTHFILPAFGHLTGLYLLEKEEDSTYFLVDGKRVLKY